MSRRVTYDYDPLTGQLILLMCEVPCAPLAIADRSGADNGDYSHADQDEAIAELVRRANIALHD